MPAETGRRFPIAIAMPTPREGRRVGFYTRRSSLVAPGLARLFPFAFPLFPFRGASRMKEPAADWLAALRRKYGHPEELRAQIRAARTGLNAAEEALLRCCPPPTPNALVLGCGAGREVLPLAARGWRVIGADLVEAVLDGLPAVPGSTEACGGTRFARRTPAPAFCRGILRRRPPPGPTPRTPAHASRPSGTTPGGRTGTRAGRNRLPQYA